MVVSVVTTVPATVTSSQGTASVCVTRVIPWAEVDSAKVMLTFYIDLF